jgi:hypothetical protein
MVLRMHVSQTIFRSLQGRMHEYMSQIEEDSDEIGSGGNQDRRAYDHARDLWAVLCHGDRICD